jgi:DNA-binding SARP family transcriptional activator/pimeloyl-ACP methyl ester carboxylesterase
MEFRLLGPLEADVEGAPLRLGGVKQRALLAVLLLNANRTVSRDRLIDDIWGEEVPDSAAKMVQIHVSQLRKVLPGGMLQTKPSGYSLELSPDAVDLHRFERFAAAGRTALAQGATETGSAELHRALALWRGPALAEFSEPFARAECGRLEQLRLAALEDRIDADLALGRHADLVAELDGLVRREPLRERLRGQQMLALYRAGRQADALAAYRAAERDLREELGIQPSAQLRELERRILEQDPELVSGTGPVAAHELLSQPATRYAINDGISLAYQVFGSGEIDLLLVTGWVLPMELFWDDPAYVRFLDRLASFCRVIMWDKRGTGQSDRLAPGQTPTLEQRMEDLGVVLDAVGSQHSAILGISEGVMLSALFAAVHPERTRALALYGGFARGFEAPDFPWGPSFEQFENFLARVQQGWGDPAQLLRYWAPSKQHDPRLRAWWARSLRFGASPTAAAQWLRMTADIDIRDVLPSIRVPTLVLHPEHDRIIRVENGRYLAEHIPDAEFVALPGEDHLWWVGDQEPLLSALERFLTGARVPRAPEHVLTTVLCAEVAGSARAGPALRDQLAAFKGREIETTGDALLASFDGPTSAIRCALAIRGTARSLGLEVRAGLHTGECELAAGGLTGVAIEVGARAAALAAPGEILVTRTVTDLVAGSDLRFESRGEHLLDGVAGQWSLLAVAVT